MPMIERPTKTRIYCSDFRFHRLGRPFSHALTFMRINTMQRNLVYTHNFGSHANLIVTSIYCLCRRTTTAQKQIPRICVTAGST